MYFKEQLNPTNPNPETAPPTGVTCDIYIVYVTLI